MQRLEFSEYRSMWLFAMFDLPVDTQEARHLYTKFRTFLLKEGFTMMQFSVYARYCASEERSEAFRRRLKKALPPKGEVRLMAVTDHQFGKMEIYRGKNLCSTEKPPDQVMLF
ncbi:MAG: CRISPR-associated endonuclease Cas2 [Actinomycetota bacterium]|nr:CRISPR-associated endonuclease Cas2 [Actinomycetota bacterium]